MGQIVDARQRTGGSNQGEEKHGSHDAGNQTQDDALNRSRQFINDEPAGICRQDFAE